MPEPIDYPAELERIALEINDGGLAKDSVLARGRQISVIRQAAALIRRQAEEIAFRQSKLDWRLATGGTADYRAAVNGEGPLAAQWADKKHRLVYDLCQQVEAQADENARLRLALAELEWADTELYNGYPVGDQCAICQNSERNGHAPDCRLKATLDAR